jgi:hypothetical protein
MDGGATFGGGLAPQLTSSAMSEQQMQMQMQMQPQPQHQREGGKPRHRHRQQQQEPERDRSATQSPSRGQKQRHNRRRKNKDALKQPPTRDMPRVLSEMLQEPKQALLHRVVRHIGPKHAWQLLKETLRLEREGGQQVNAVGSGTPNKFLVVDEQSRELKARRRTTGGVYLALLKEQVPRDTYRSIYEIEDKKKKEAKKRLRNRVQQQMEKTLDKLGFDDLTLASEAPPAEHQADGSETRAGTVAATIAITAPAADAVLEDGEL